MICDFNASETFFVSKNIIISIMIPQCGVPQGSIGGPILWLIFKCDQPDVNHNHPIDIYDSNRGCLSTNITNIQKNKVSVIQECGVMVGYVDDGAYSFASSSPDS